MFSRLPLLVLLAASIGSKAQNSAGKASFSTFMWIKGGEVFTDTRTVEVEMVNAGAFALEAYDSSDHLVSKGERANAHGGWSTFDFRAGMSPLLFGGKHKLKLVNRSAGTREVKQGIVTPGI